MGEERNFEFFIGDCQLPAVVSPESTIWLLPADSNEEEVSGSIKKYVEYTGEEQSVTVFWDVEEFLYAGSYGVDIFADGNLIGSKRFTIE